MSTASDNKSLLDPHALAQLQGLELRARRIVEGYVSGVHRSPYHGFSIEFAEHREYAPGDDLRYVDWKVFGRTDKIYLKQYEDETNLLCYIVLDTSESMQYRGPDSPLSKLEYAQCVAASLAWLVLQHQDAVGIATFDSEVRSFIRPSSSASHLKQVLHTLENVTSDKKTSAGPIFHDLAERFTKRGVVVILSDLFDDVGSMMAGLKHFHHRRHDCVVLHTLDAAELDFPFRRLTKFQGLERMPEVLTDPRALRKAYLEEFNKFLRDVKTGCRGQQMDYQRMPTDQSLGAALSSFLAARAART
ncbi:MAG: DUF58 domain-containing protein [Planctomycetales bacterium]|nr:DUF58 domain-containing protein [Planctomycetales bacterium]